MRISKLFIAPCYHDCYVIRTVDGEYMRFYDTPSRVIGADDLTPVPYYREMGNNAKEAPAYIWKIYGLERAGSETQEQEVII